MASIEQQIAVKIKAIVTGLSDVQALALTVRSLNRTSGTGLSALSRDVGVAGRASKSALPHVNDLAIGLGRLTENSQKRGLGVFIKDLGEAGRKLKEFQDLQKLDPFQNANNLGFGAASKALKADESRRNSLMSSGIAGGLAKHDPFQSATNVSLGQAARDLALFNSHATKSQGLLSGLSFGTSNVTKSFMGFKVAATGASAVLLSVVAAAAALVAVLAAAGVALAGFGLYKIVQEGIRFNAVIESAKIGIATLVSNTFDLVDANGKVLEPVEAFNAALTESEEIERKLQLAAIKTKFEFEEILSFFNSTLVAGAGLNASVDQLVTLTQDFALAAGAANIPVEKVNTGIKQILTGVTTVRNDLARVIFPGQTTKEINAFLKEMRAAGTLVEALEEKLMRFHLSQDQVAQSFDAVASNAADAFKVFAADATIKLFERIKQVLGFIIDQIVDLSAESVKLQPTFQRVADLLNDILGFLGDEMLDVVKDIFEWFGGWVAYITENREAFEDMFLAVIAIAEQIGGILADLFGVVGQVGEANNSTSGWVTTLQAVAMFFGFIRDILNIIIGSCQVVIGLLGVGLVEALARPISKALEFFGIISDAASLLNSLSGGAMNFASSGAFRAASGLEFQGLFGAQDRMNQDILNNRRTGNQTRTTPRPRPGGGSGGGARGNAEREAKERLRAAQQLNDAIEKLLISNAKREAELVADANSIILETYQRRYDEGLLQAEDFYKKKQALQISDLDAEKKSLEKSKVFARNALLRDLGALQGKFSLSEAEAAPIIQAIEQLSPDDLATASPVLVKQATEYAKWLEQSAQITQDLVKNGNERKKIELATTEAIRDQARATKQLATDLDAEFASSVGNDGLSELLQLQKRVSDELPKVLVATNKGFEDFATKIHDEANVSIEGFLALLDEAGVKVDSLSDPTRRLIAILKRMDFLAAQKQTSGEASKIIAGLNTDLAGLEGDVAQGRTSHGSAQDQIKSGQAAALAQLNEKLKTYTDRIAAAKAAGVVVTQEDINAANELGQAIKAINDAQLRASIDDEAARSMASLDAKRESLDLRREAGSVNAKKARQELLALQQQELAVLELQLQKYLQLDQTIPANAQRVAELRNQIAAQHNEMNSQFISFAAGINDSIGASISSFVDTIIDGTDSIGNAFRKMISGLLLGIAKAIAQALLLKFVLEPLGLAGGSSGGFGGLLGGLIFGKKAEGGIISGSGTGVSDSAGLFALSHGEAVIPARNVARYGRGMMQALINGSFVPRMSFGRLAAGGIVGGDSGFGGGRGGTRIINSLDPNLVKDFMSSAEGEEVILNVIGKNPGLVQRLA